MTKLSDTQAIVLAAATQRSDGNLLPLPGSLRGGAADKVVTALLTRGFVREEVTDRITRADAAMNTVWRNDDDGRAILLRTTAAGREAIGVELTQDQDRNASAAAATATLGAVTAETPGPAEAAQTEAPQRGVAGRTDSTTHGDSLAPENVEPPSASHTGPLRGKTREGTKQAQLIAMLERKEGTTIEQIVAATGWQPHTVRGAFAGALKKKLGLTVTSEKVVGRGRVYRIEP